MHILINRTQSKTLHLKKRNKNLPFYPTFAIHAHDPSPLLRRSGILHAFDGVECSIAHTCVKESKIQFADIVGREKKCLICLVRTSKVNHISEQVKKRKRKNISLQVCQ